MRPTAMKRSGISVAETERFIERERLLAGHLAQFAGQWVAVRDHEILAHAKTPDRLDEQLAEEVEPYRTFRVTRGAGSTLL
jgi:hypothetical protein